MKVKALVIGWMAMMLSGAVVSARAEEPAAEDAGLGLEVGADYASTYLFRGVGLLPNDENVLYAHAKYGFKGLTATYYGYQGDLSAGAKYREHDLSLDYTLSLGGGASLTAGAITYQYSGDVERELGFLNTYELYAIVSFEGPLAPTISYYRDIDKVKGGYLTVAIGHSVDLGPRVSLAFSGAVGLDFHYNNKDTGNATFNDVLVGIDLPVQITQQVKFHLLAQRSFAQKSLDDLARRNPSSARQVRNQTIATAGLSVAF